MTKPSEFNEGSQMGDKVITVDDVRASFKQSWKEIKEIELEKLGYIKKKLPIKSIDELHVPTEEKNVYWMLHLVFNLLSLFTKLFIK